MAEAQSQLALDGPDDPKATMSDEEAQHLAHGGTDLQSIEVVKDGKVTERIDLSGGDDPINLPTDEPPLNLEAIDRAPLGDTQPCYSGLDIHSRLQKIREARGQMETEFVKALGYKTVSHAKVIKLVRPLFLKWGVIWMPIGCDVVRTDLVERTKASGGTTMWYSVMVKWTFRFQCVGYVEDREAGTHVDIPVLSHGLDNSDKGLGKSQTYGEKYAIYASMGLERSDDPDVTPLDLSPDMPEDIEQRILRIKQLLELDPEVTDVDAKMRDLAESFSRRYGRRVANLSGLDAVVLDQIVAKLDNHITDVNGGPNGNGGPPPASS